MGCLAKPTPSGMCHVFALNVTCLPQARQRGPLAFSAVAALVLAFYEQEGVLAGGYMVCLWLGKPH